MIRIQVDYLAFNMSFILCSTNRPLHFSKKWSQDELNFLSELDDSSIFDCQVLQLIPNDSQLNQPHILIGAREHGQKAEDIICEKYNTHSLKAISAHSQSKNKKKFTQRYFKSSLRKAS